MLSTTPPRPTDGDPGAFLEGRFLTRKTLISFFVAFAFLFFLLFRVLRVDIGALLDNLRNSNPAWYALALIVYYAGFPLRAWRWQVLLRNTGFSKASDLPSRRRLGEAIVLSWFFNCIMPAKLGDAYRAYLLRKDSRVGFMTGLGTVLAERAVDIVILFLLLVMAAAIGLGGWGSRTSEAVVATGLALTIGVVAGLVFVQRFGQAIQRRLPARLQPLFSDVHRGVLGSLKQLPLVAVLSILIWSTEVGRLFLIAQSLGFSVSFSLILFAAMATALLTAIPFTPAGLGLVEGGVIGILVTSMSRTDAASVALLDRTLTYYSFLIVGVAILVVRGSWGARIRGTWRRRFKAQAAGADRVGH